jgi:hypothetical protein
MPSNTASVTDACVAALLRPASCGAAKRGRLGDEMGAGRTMLPYERA